MDKVKISEITHPEYDTSLTDWGKFRGVFEGGHTFVDNYLEKLSLRENEDDFSARKAISYCPAHAKSVLLEIQYAIYSRMVEIVREGGPKSYQNAIVGLDKGVDHLGNSMSAFMGSKILPELLAMSKIGVYIDKAPIPDNASLADTNGIRPYLYYYQAEDIRSWAFDDNHRLKSLLLRDHIDVVDEEYGLITDDTTQYRLLNRTNDGIHVRFYNKNEELINEQDINLEEIPFILFKIDRSLLSDVADYQIALLQLASSDLNYAIKANFPFYTEQFNPLAEGTHLRPVADNIGTEDDSKYADSKRIKVGATDGRRYPQGLERPGFIHPSSEPIVASMNKQKEMKEDIRELVHLSLANLTPKRESAESKAYDARGLDAGLSHIGFILSQGEEEIAKVWAKYEGGDPATIRYPRDYTIRTEAERRTEADELAKLLPTVPSKTYQKNIAKRIAKLLVGQTATIAEMKSIDSEIEASAVIVSDPEVIAIDIENGLVSTELASKIRGYPEGEVEKAKIDHAERAARIALAQSKANQQGVADMQSASGDDKDNTQDASLQDSGGKAVRGEAQ